MPCLQFVDFMKRNDLNKGGTGVFFLVTGGFLAAPGLKINNHFFFIYHLEFILLTNYLYKL